jgi:methylmalonyl-CoA/ethylmalonyl-CoA epimerase
MKIKRIEHVAIAVDDLDASKSMLSDIFGLDVELEETIGSTKLSMHPVGQTYIELLEAMGEDSPVADWINERGQSLFHLCFEVEDIDEALRELKEKNVALIDETPRSGHGGSKIAFLDPSATGNILIELAELPAGH